jgi:hypothetical protein
LIAVPVHTLLRVRRGGSVTVDHDSKCTMTDNEREGAGMMAIPPVRGGANEEVGAPIAIAANEEGQGHLHIHGWLGENGWEFHADTFREAVQFMEHRGGRPISWLWIRPHDEDLTVSEAEENSPLEFRRFVASLGTSSIRAIKFSRVRWCSLPDDDVERLFGKVLPAHHTLEEIYFDGYVRARFLQHFTSSAARGTPLVKLYFHGLHVDMSQAQVIADMLRRNAPLLHLHVHLCYGKNDPDICKLICQSALHATNLQVLKIMLADCPAYPYALDNVAASPSLQHLAVHTGNPTPNETLERIANQLRTNTVMTHLSLTYLMSWVENPGLYHPIANVLETYNFKIQSVGVVCTGIPDRK